MFFCVGGSAVDVAGAKLKCEQLRASDDGESLSHWHARHEDQSEWCVTNLFVRCKWKREVSVKKIISYISNRFLRWDGVQFSVRVIRSYWTSCDLRFRNFAGKLPAVIIPLASKTTYTTVKYSLYSTTTTTLKHAQMDARIRSRQWAILLF